MIQAAADAQIEQAAAGAGPRVLLVSDNRDNANWGSRATTMALLELMAAAGLSPSDRVLDGEVRSRVALADGPVAGRLLRRPALARLAGAGLARGGRTRLSLERLGVRDAVSDDPAQTVRRWRRSGREPLAEWIARVERADAVVVNGEGSMIFTTPSRLVTTRDPWSQAFLHEVAPEVASVYVPDSVFAWKGRVGRGRDLLARPEYLTPFHDRPDRLGTWDFQRPYICVGGSSEAAKEPKRAAASYQRLLQALPELGYPVVVTVSSTGDAFLEELAHELGLPLVPADTNVMVATEILAHAELVVTGRYHPAILAGLGGVPGVLLGADSHKTASVQQMLGYPDIHVFAEQPTAADVSAILQRARRVLAERQRWQEAIETALALRAAEARRLTGHLESLGQVSA